MISYSFTYTDVSGSVIRWTAMQCLSDADAIDRARDTMRDKYAGLKIFAGERAVYGLGPVAA